MGYVLYGRRQTGSMVVEAALTLVGAAYSFRAVPSPASVEKRAVYTKINPRGQVPALIHPDGTVITEGPAILNHLADAFPEAGLAPPPGSAQRAWHDRWLAFFHANVYEGMLRELIPDRYTTDASGSAALSEAATAYVRRHFLIFEAELAHRPQGDFFCGAGPSALDLYLWMLCFWIDADWLAANCPRLAAHWHRMREREALAPVEVAHFG
ncbi:MAG: glutathione S-transferase family protein [Proteobacteria bacterium]|nr:glutathione S-transferase family protein [Pseudomonadota bacterium]